MLSGCGFKFVAYAPKPYILLTHDVWDRMILGDTKLHSCASARRQQGPGFNSRVHMYACMYERMHVHDMHIWSQLLIMIRIWRGF